MAHASTFNEDSSSRRGSAPSPLRIPGVEILEEMTATARGSVYRARHGNDIVAVKVPNVAANSDEMPTFFSEAGALASFTHPTLARTLHVGEVDGRPFVVMQYVDGESLAARLGRLGSLPEADVVRVAQAVAAALAALHRRKLVHPHVSAGNIVLDAQGQVTLVDLGFAQKSLDGQADLDALGAVLFTCATGTPLAQRPKERPGAGVLGLRPDLNPGLAAIIDKLSAWEPSQRYGTAAALVCDLEHLDAITARLSAGQNAGLDAPTSPRRNHRQAHLWGREDAVAELERAWQATRAGHGRVALITGELGLGKSRLIKTFASAAEQDGALVLRAAPDTERGEPFTPLGALLANLARRLTTLTEAQRGTVTAQVAAAMGDNGPLLCRIAPDLAGVCRAPRGTGRRAFALPQLSGALTQFFTALARRLGGLVLCIDDVQVSDVASQRLLIDLLEHLGDAPVLVLLGGRDPLPLPLGDELRRVCVNTGGVHLPLGRLSQAALRLMLVEMLGTDDLDSELVNALTTRAHGNPWVMREYVRALLASGALRPAWGQWHLDRGQLEHVLLPGDALKLITQRVLLLQPAAQKVLQVAALLGPVCERDDVEACVDTLPHTTWAALDEALHLHILESHDNQTYRFVHEAVGAALVANLTPAALQQLHLRIAQTLDAQPRREAAHLYRIAHHYACAGAPEQRARTYSTNREAGLQAAAAFAYAQACAYLRTALASAPSEAARHDYALHQTLGEVQLALGQRHEALQAFEQARRAARIPLERANVALLRAAIHHLDGDGAMAWTELSDGYEALGQQPPSARHWFYALGALVARAVVRRPRSGTPEPRGRQAGPLRETLLRLHELAAKVAFGRNQRNAAYQAVLRMAAVATAPAHWARVFSYVAGAAAVAHWPRIARWALHRAEAHARRAGEPEWARTQLSAAWVAHGSGDERRAASLAQVCLSESGPGLDPDDFAVACTALAHTLVRRGYGSEAADWLERLEQRVPGGAASGAPRTPLARCTAELLGRSPRRPVHSVVATPFDEALADLFACLEHGEVGEAMERALTTCDAHRGEANPFQWQTFLMWQAYGRRAQWEHAGTSGSGGPTERRLADAVSAVRHAGRDSPVVRCHGVIVAASLARLRGQWQQARRLLTQGEAAAFTQADLTAHFEIARERARLARAAGDLDAMLLLAQGAHAIASEHGWQRRQRQVAQEFSLNHGEERSVPPEPPLTKTRRERDALVRTSLASCRCETAASSVRGALSELLQTLGAARAAYFACDHGALTLMAALDRQGHDVRDTFAKEPHLVLKAQKERQAVLRADARTCALAVPLRRADDVVGVVYMENATQLDPFAQDDADVVAAVAAHVPLALAAQRGNRLTFYEKLTAEVPGVLFQLERRGEATAPTYAFTMVSPGAQTLLGVPAHAMERDLDAWMERLDGEGRTRFLTKLEHSASVLTAFTWEGRLLRDGKETWVGAIAKPCASDDGAVQWTGMLFDISEHKQTEKALERALADVTELSARERHRAEALMDTRDQLLTAQQHLQAAQAHLVQKEKMSALGRLANGLAHEINNPLAGVQHLVEALQASANLDPSRREAYLTLIQSGLVRIHTTVTNLMTYAQPQPPHLKPHDARTLLHEAIERVRPIAASKEARLHVNTPTVPVTVWADGRQLVQALANVLHNAVHASPPNATVHAELTETDSGVRVYVRDRGVGIPEEYLHRVCDPFFTTKQQGEGNGLGLSTAQRITVAHGGDLRVETREGHGTRVIFDLPKVPVATVSV